MMEFEKGIIKLETDTVLDKQLKFIGVMLQVLGVFGIINGVIMCLTLIGAIMGVPYIMGALKIIKSGSLMIDTSKTNSGVSLKDGLGSLAKGMKLILIGIILSICLYIVLLILLVVFGGFASYMGSIQ